MIDGFQDIGPYLSLASALSLCFANKSKGGGAIITCKGSTVALFVTSMKYFVFDPHARDNKGYANPDGSAVLLAVCGFSNCLILLRRIFQTENRSPLELHRIIIKCGGKVPSDERQKCLLVHSEEGMCQTC